jgi:hypothetical protein
MANLSIVLTATLTVSDTTLAPSPTIVSRSLNNPTNAATVSFYDPFFQVTGATVVNLPAATCFIGYVKNLDAAATLTVAWTAVGAAGSSTMVLVPGGVFIYFLPTESAGGFTAMTLTPSAGTISAEVLLGK